jgi:hypothetical protein
MPEPVYDLESDVEWDGVDPTDWRNLPDEDADDDDVDEPTPPYVEDVLGFDPDELFEEE